ncbi:MAG: CoB--CoM heterodisulfide reductase iron-sulfur subunit B family protein [Methanoregula sp.]|jgi:heterodisulfide reductase subunit B|uniref:CoB--CoM heterodisulfide reductase iron-sulfur subunit B family protein n=1 Tax=Methanoregula sp. TaxID=2052170 RepID=UPI003C1A19B5
MKASYYPGCALHGTALEYDESARAVARLLGVELVELPDWSCCGASSAHATDEALALNLAARNLTIAGTQGMDLIVPCAACYSRLKAAERKISGDRGRDSGFRVLNPMEFLFLSGLSVRLQELVKRPLTGLKVVCYYGCLLVRPPDVTGVKQYEHPEEMDRLIELMGAEPIPWSYKTDCCGGSLSLTRTDIVMRLTGKLFEKAIEAGAEAMVVACPLCQSNLDSRQEEISRESGNHYELPIFYFTELIGLALGHRDADKWFKRHFVDPRKLLASKGLVRGRSNEKE